MYCAQRLKAVGKKKDRMEIMAKNVEPANGSLYDVLQRRIADVRKSGMVNTCGNLLRYVTEGPSGPLLPSVCPGVFRMNLARKWDLPTSGGEN